MGSGWQHTILSGRALAYIAAISFALYVWHSPFRHGWWDSGSDLERYLFKRPLAFMSIFALAHLSTFYFEQPVTRWVRARTAHLKTTN
jgi:peptidoglycan/LPS O-acetylase OafA/YrhL